MSKSVEVNKVIVRGCCIGTPEVPFTTCDDVHDPSKPWIFERLGIFSFDAIAKRVKEKHGALRLDIFKTELESFIEGCYKEAVKGVGSHE